MNLEVFEELRRTLGASDRMESHFLTKPMESEVVQRGVNDCIITS